jgi:arylsulfatase A-like enzyme
VHCAPSSSTAAAPPTIIHLVADDLGYHDTNWRNHQVSTDALDALVKVGVEIPDFYVYKMCAPSRGSVLSGRYPWHVGYYDNNGGGGPPLGFKFLPELIEPTYDSHALGKVSSGRAAVALPPAAALR